MMIYIFLHIYICLHLFTLFVASDDQKFVWKPNFCELSFYNFILISKFKDYTVMYTNYRTSQKFDSPMVI